ncbi:YbaB/EbfC family nucleoid-associated protein [Amycolatopsis thermoflava]|uniref:YbaB/EbfC family nucleoid-associated protein n=1 Tax=Amycolatopsis thermoflava TaxID=84480 RepID=UPI000425BBC1|nr:YbaB/EbfC family nucleoid-associated protein [Amycolatopsis thermoflava]
MEFPADRVDPVFQEMLEELQQATANLPAAQQRMLEMTGIAWSPDRTVKVVVGPRGQLVDLEIDPRVFRKPDAAALQAMILEASAEAVAQVQAQIQELMAEHFSPAFSELQEQVQPERAGAMDYLHRPDAEIYAERKAERKAER